MGLIVALAFATKSTAEAAEPAQETVQTVVSAILKDEGITGAPSITLDETPYHVHARVALLQKTKDAPRLIARHILEKLKTTARGKSLSVTVSSYSLDRTLSYVLKDTDEEHYKPDPPVRSAADFIAP